MVNFGMRFVVNVSLGLNLVVLIVCGGLNLIFCVVMCDVWWL